jgi:hypothetical protein
MGSTNVAMLIVVKAHGAPVVVVVADVSGMTGFLTHGGQNV